MSNEVDFISFGTSEEPTPLSSQRDHGVQSISRRSHHAPDHDSLTDSDDSAAEAYDQVHIAGAAQAGGPNLHRKIRVPKSVRATADKIRGTKPATAPKDRQRTPSVSLPMVTVEDSGPAQLVAKRKREEIKSQPNHLRSTLGCVFERGRNTLPPWLVNVKESRTPCYTSNVYRILHTEMLDFLDYISPTPEEHQLRQWVVDRIDRVVKSLWPDAVTKVFGSYSTHLYLPDSDIDIVIFVDGIEEDLAMHKAATVKVHLNRLAAELRRERITAGFKVLSRARVPIIKMIDSITKIPVDISFHMVSGVRSASIVQQYLSEGWPRTLRALTVVIKQFLLQRGQNEVFTGGLGSYGLINLIVSFLQLHPKVQSGQIDPDENLGVLLLEFFELYGKKFNYATTGIRTSNGGGYFDKRTRSFCQQQQPYMLCIEDPQDPENDITRGTFGIYRIKQFFSGAFEGLTAHIYQYCVLVEEGRLMDTAYRRSWSDANQVPRGTMEHLNTAESHATHQDAMHRVRGRSTSSQHHLHFTDDSSPAPARDDSLVPRADFVVSFLSTILRISPACLAQRRHLAEVFYSGQFQSLLNTTFVPQLSKSLVGLDKAKSPVPRVLAPVQDVASAVGNEAAQVDLLEHDYANHTAVIMVSSDSATDHGPYVDASDASDDLLLVTSPTPLVSQSKRPQITDKKTPPRVSLPASPRVKTETEIESTNGQAGIAPCFNHQTNPDETRDSESDDSDDLSRVDTMMMTKRQRRMAYWATKAYKRSSAAPPSGSEKDDFSNGSDNEVITMSSGIDE